jgi:hypothetical protein
VRPGGLIVAHDVSQQVADPRYVRAISGRADTETILLNTFWGISVTLKKH